MPTRHISWLKSRLERLRGQNDGNSPSFNPATQIRVLVVEAGEPDSPVTTSFQVCALQGKRDIEWEAISYAWGSQTGSQEIELHGETIKVADNVFRILRDLRLQEQRRFLWIDAVCIDQDNYNEKSKQVALMRDIYQEAQSVIIWLDTNGIDDAASAVFSTAHWMNTKTKNFSQSQARHLQDVFTRENPTIYWNLPFDRIASLRWFQRIWVLQEAVFGVNLQVFLGQRYLPWDLFASTTIRFLSLLRPQEAIGNTLEECYAVCREKLFDDETKRGLSMIYLIMTLRTWLKESDVPIIPSELLLLCKDREATLPSDMVYAVSGFFGVKRASSPAILFPIDYRLSTAEVYKRFTVWCIQQERNLDILAQQRNEDGTGRSSLSSWTTDWNDQVLGGYSLPETLPLLSRLRHPSSIKLNVIPSCRRRQDILAVRGFIVDDFADDVFCPTVTPLDSEEDRTLYQQWLSKISDDESTNELLFGERCPSVETLKRLSLQTEEKDSYFSHLWRDGKRSNLAVREPGAGFRSLFVTNRGCLALCFPHFNFNPSPKICYLLGGRGLFVLKQVTSDRSSNKAFYNLVSGDCFINGFEDGKGYEICKALGLKEQDICIV